jgi:hypothetical protein
MAITTYAELQTAVAAWDKRTGDTSYTTYVPDFIALCEADLQVRCKLVEFETTATVTITSGSGTLPTGFLAMRSVYWDGDPDYPLSYLTPEQFDAMRGSDSGDGYYYTISGSTIRTTPMGSGSVVMTYSARFTPLASGVNAILTNFPDAYLYGSLYQGALFRKDDPAAQKYAQLFGSAVERINLNNEQRKYAGSPMQVRVR